MPSKTAEWFEKALRRAEGTPEYEEAKLLLDVTEGFLQRHPEETEAVAALTRLIDRSTDQLDDMEERPDVIVAVAVWYGSTGRVLLGRRGEKVEGPGLFGLPGGHLRRGERVQDCAHREVREETGITHLYNLHVVDVQDDHRPEDGICQPVIFFGGLTSQNPTNKEPGKCDGWEWYPIDKLPPKEEMFATMVRFFEKLKGEA